MLIKRYAERYNPAFLVFGPQGCLVRVRHCCLSEVDSICILPRSHLCVTPVPIPRSDIIENLGAATVIASDKTGTLTQNRMTVENIWVNRTFRGTPEIAPSAFGGESTLVEMKDDSEQATIRSRAARGSAALARASRTAELAARKSVSDPVAAMAKGASMCVCKQQNARVSKMALRAWCDASMRLRPDTGSVCCALDWKPSLVLVCMCNIRTCASLNPLVRGVTPLCVFAQIPVQ